MNEKPNKIESRDVIWKIILTIICLGILLYGYFYSTNTSQDLAHLLGYNLPSAVLIWVVFYISVTRKKGTRVSGLSFILIFISLTASSLIGYSQQKKEAKVALSEIQREYSDLNESTTSSQGISKRIDRPIDTTPKAGGDFGKIERLVKEFMDEMRLQRNDYLLELEAIGWSSILNANRIKDDKTFIESSVIIEKAKTVVNKYKEQSNILLERTKENIRSSNIREDFRKQMLSGFEKGMIGAKVNIDQIWVLELKVVNEFEKIVNLLSAKKEAWVIKKGQILFYDSSDLERFNFYLASIQDIVEQQTVIQRESRQIANKNLDYEYLKRSYWEGSTNE